MDWGAILKAGGTIVAAATAGVVGNQEIREPNVQLKDCTDQVVLEFMVEQVTLQGAEVERLRAVIIEHRIEHPEWEGE